MSSEIFGHGRVVFGNPGILWLKNLTLLTQKKLAGIAVSDANLMARQVQFFWNIILEFIKTFIM